jgi:pentatricopeptide repeat protein
MVSRAIRPTSAEFYAKVIDALLSPGVQDTSLALRVLDDAKMQGVATQAMYSSVLRGASSNHPDIGRVASELQETMQEELLESTLALLREFHEHRALAELHIYSAYTKGSGAQWRKLADYMVPRSTAAELDQEFRILLYMMEAAGDFFGCRAVFQYLMEKGIAFPDVSVCENLLTSAVRAKDVKFAEWLLHIIVARVGATEPMYSRVAHLQCQLKDFAGSIKTFASIRSKGLSVSSDSLRTQLTALAQIGDLKGFASESAALKEQQSNLFTLASLKLLSVLSKRGSYPDLARLLVLTESLLRPDFRYFATMLHIAAHIDDHERFYSLLAEMRTAGIAPHVSVFGELLSSMQRTGRVEVDRLLDTIRAHGLVPDANLLSQLAVLQGGTKQGILDNSATLTHTRTMHSAARVTQTLPDPAQIPSGDIPRRTQTPERDTKAEVFATLRSAEKIGVWNALNELDQRKVVGLPFYNGLLGAYSRKENLAACREVLRKMEAKGVRADTTSYNLILAATKTPRIDEYRRLFEDMKAKGVAPNERTYNGFLSLLSKRRHWADFDRVLDEMRSTGVAPNMSTHSIILNSAAVRGDLQACQQAAETLRKIGPLGPSAYTSLIVASCTSGSIDQANQYLQEMIDNRIHPEVHAFNKIMQVCEKRGAAKESWRLLDEMIRVGVKRNMESYATVVRTVLNQVGNDDKDMPGILWEFSKWVLGDMKTQGITPDMSVFGPIADYMAKMGELARFNEVREWMREHNMTPDAHTLSTLVKQLAARQSYDQARSALKSMWGDTTKPTGVAYAALLNALVDAERWTDCESVLQEFKAAETGDVALLCEKIIEAGKSGDTLERAKLTALLQPINKIVL